MRLTSEFWVSVLMRRVRGEGGFAYLTRRGSNEAGAIFIQQVNLDRSISLYGPAPQSFYGEDTDIGERLFIKILDKVDENQSIEKLEKELRFDADLWLVEIEDFPNNNLPFEVVKVNS